MELSHIFLAVPLHWPFQIFGPYLAFVSDLKTVLTIFCSNQEVQNMPDHISFPQPNFYDIPAALLMVERNGSMLFSPALFLLNSLPFGE